MKALKAVRSDIISGNYDKLLIDIYVDEKQLAYQQDRYVRALDKFEALYGDKEIAIYSAPGRSEVGGNHTDHQRGQVLACAVNLDAIGVVAARSDDQIIVVSDSFVINPVDVSDIEKKDSEEGTSEALIRGVAARFKQAGYNIGGFEAFITSDVLVGAGLSSSAAFEVLIGNILSYLYNDGVVDAVFIAQAAQYAENVYFGKPCGLMDQMASSVGNLINIDFEDVDKPLINKVDVEFDKFGYSLCIVDTKGSHADLTPEYAAIPKEMKEVAGFFGKSVLREVDKKEFYANIPAIREKFGDRGVIRAIHFYDDHERVSKEVKALEKGNFDKFLRNINKSGDSSFQYLQNVFPVSAVQNQGVALCIALSKKILKGEGAVRVHGGGFAGTIQAFVPNEIVAKYKKKIEKYFGEDSCHILKVRKYGGMKVID